MRDRYLVITQWRAFVMALDAVLLLMALGKILTVWAIVEDGPGVRGFTEWAALDASIAGGVLIVIGAVCLPRSRAAAYSWFERGLLFEILVTQVFVFAKEQLAGVVGLIVTVAVWIAVRSALRAERERQYVTLKS